MSIPLMKIVVVDHCSPTVITEAQAAQVTAACARQVNEHFAPIWGYDAEVVYQPAKGAPPPVVSPETYQVILMDKSDVADALGYHDRDAAGKPIAFIGVKTTIDDGENWSVTLSHEILEMIADPWLTATAVHIAGKKAQVWAWEVCDPCQESSYQIDGVGVSDFVTPDFFNDTPAAGAKLTYLGSLTKPFTIGKGGYAIVLKGTRWGQVMGKKVPEHKHTPAKGRRRHARIQKLPVA